MGPLLSSAEKDAVQNNIFIYCENFLNCKKKKCASWLKAASVLEALLIVKSVQYV